LLMQIGRTQEARAAFDRVVTLAHTPAEAAHIRLHLDRPAGTVSLHDCNAERSIPFA
jgi:RNA polymerase sigma-70 factor, ECF subfamily